MVDAFDSDVLIYAAVGHDLGHGVKRMFERLDHPRQRVGIGSVMLLPEVLSKPLRDQQAAQHVKLQGMLSRLELHPADQQIALLATSLGATYRLRAADAIHLATAVAGGADRFITNNRSDFTAEITEIDVVYPDQLA
ncbi:type II toxin-antitoxin system VapC family toxin [Pseudactinotalea terrae]|uniref:type II toxin-antitoxin system VapC family toxin n=1 Tax=Pseudactinotalea terrae TaxID=1743262 RepID=UPI0012E1B00A|nr:PIN domain-containing protein [Pseudactinotalea terrae]